jgi:hypothetical protein
MPAAQPHHLSQALFDLRPALEEEPHFLLAPDQRRNPVGPTTSSRLWTPLSLMI